MSSRLCYTMALLLPVLLGGCLADEGTFYIKAMRPAQVRCVPPAPGGTEGLSQGMLDVAPRVGYFAFPEVINGYPPTAVAGTAGIAETNNMQLREFKVELDLGQVPGSYAAGLLKFSVPVSGTIAPNGALTVGLKIISDQLAAQLVGVVPLAEQPTIIAKLKVSGKLAASSRESPEFVFPLGLCNGCLVGDPKGLEKPCPAATSPEAALVKSNNCGSPQDEPVTCCKDVDLAVGYKCYRKGTTL